MNKNERPIVVPTALSCGVILWSLVFAAYFGAALFAYFAWCRFDVARTRLATPEPTPVRAELFSCLVPANYARYSLRGNHLTMHRFADRDVPLMSFVAQRDPAFAYRALDLNPAFLAQRIKKLLEDEGLVKDGDGSSDPIVLSTEMLHAWSGHPTASAFFDLGAREGIAYMLFAGDICVMMVSVWEDAERVDIEKVHMSLARLTQNIDLPFAPERFTRPIVNSAELDADEHARILGEVARERALWKLFAARVESEPEAVLLPAIEHFRRMLSLLSSVREERDVLGSDDFRLYERFLKRRAAVLKDWFVLLDKHLAVGDLPAAEKQADFIVRHATLEDESLSRRRAGQTLAEIKNRIAAAAGEK